MIKDCFGRLWAVEKNEKNKPDYLLCDGKRQSKLGPKFSDKDLKFVVKNEEKVSTRAHDRAVEESLKKQYESHFTQEELDKKKDKKYHEDEARKKVKVKKVPAKKRRSKS